MKLAALGSGSSGNATLLDTGNGLVVIDCGLTLKEVKRRLQQIGNSPTDIVAILVTHEHSDHISGVAALSRHSGAPVYATRGTQKKLQNLEVSNVLAEQAFLLPETGVEVLPVAVPHDAREPVQYVFCKGGFKAGVLTDLGCGTPHIAEAYANCDALLIEANHDREMLMNGNYPAALKRRIMSNWGHLSNCQTRSLLQQIFAVGKSPDTLVLGHLSQENNHPDRVMSSLEGLSMETTDVMLALQDEPLGWVG